MQLPTMSLRVAKEHQQLIRDIGLALRTRPELVDVLQSVLQTQPNVAPRNTDALHMQYDGDTDVLQAFQERLTIQSEGLQRIMAFAENINERVKALELPDALRNTDGNTGVLQSILDRLAALEGRPATPRPATGGNNDIPMHVVEEAARLWDGGKGLSFPQIAAEKKEEWAWTAKGLNKAVRKHLARTG
jgi:hypothetical protein